MNYDDFFLDDPGLVTKADDRTSYYRNTRNNEIHKQGCTRLSSTRRVQWSWAKGKTSQQVIAECSINAYGFTPCPKCLKKEIEI